MRRAYKYKVKLNAMARRGACSQLALLAELHNAAIEERREAWKRQRKSISFYDQTRQLKDIKRDRPEFAAIGSQVLECALQRVDLAFKAFYRRVRAGQRPGYPRFKGARRYDSLTFRKNGWKLEGRRLRMQGIGIAKLFLSRPIEGTIKTVTLSRDACGDWWVVFSCENVAAKPLPDTGESIGIDLGLSSYVALSNGETVANPQPASAAEACVSRAARRVTKKTRGGAKWKRSVRCLAKHHRHVQNVRRDFQWKLARDLASRFDLLAVEDLNVRGLARSRLAKAVSDAAWGDFLYCLTVKAEDAGRVIVQVDPRGTSQVCSDCGCVVEKDLSVRVHRCDCGYIADRDVNAARNILAIAQAERAASRLVSKTAA